MTLQNPHKESRHFVGYHNVCNLQDNKTYDNYYYSLFIYLKSFKTNIEYKGKVL